jgi:uncharacterized protein YuzE
MHFHVTVLTRLLRHPICSFRQWIGRDMPASSDNRLHLKYEPDYDLLSVWIGTPTVADTVEVEPGISVRVANSGEVIGIEVVDAAARLQKDPATLENPKFARAILRKYGTVALSELHPSHAR